MANSSLLAEVLPAQKQQQQRKQKSTSKTSTNDKINRFKSSPTCHVPEYKYKSNFPPDLIEEMRDLLKADRAKQTKEEYDYWTGDFNRMMKDDWLITRFFLRGFKASVLSRGTAASDDDDDEDDDVSVDESSKSLGFKRTLELVETCGKFRKEFNVTSDTKIDGFPVEWLQANGLFNYKQDLRGNPTLWLRIKIFKPREISSDELRFEFKRYLLYMAEQCDKDLFNRPGNCVCAVWDMTNATFENFDLEMTSWMMKMSKLGPKYINYVLVYNLPWFLNTTFKIIANTFMSNGNRVIKFAYGNEIYNFISRNNLPDYLLEQLDNK